ncbi:hypothetical protein J31TS4_36260 [Paenibacillus sp. J31TS4]|uniref:GNAT family N-acetyltransferase n=1 Tax=Paenibacillus sp. J31TS4 TaxID=2807195 RepID=UPI001B05DA29|nr:GNAT family N-acetyltransferase [Paenibacillus sp. J31TS4]GIP40346.1 hypothetical protein J31TS4_36260 [Paenibacillus sp. J31TS4]
MATIRRLQAGDFEAAIALSDQIFRDAEQVSMGRGFPFVFSPELGQSYGAFEEDRLVSFMGLVPSVLRVGPASIGAYSLGSVCTHPDARGKGIASQMLQDIFAFAERAEASVLLISGGRGLYRTSNCHPFGVIQQYLLDDSSAEKFRQSGGGAGCQVREADDADWFRIHRLAESRAVRFEQSLWDLAQLIKAEAICSCIKLSHKVLLAEREGEAVAFAVIGVPYPQVKGKRAPLLIEWAGDAAAVTALLTDALSRYELDRLIAPAPWFEEQLAQQLQAIAAEANPENRTHTIKLINPARLLEELAPWLRQKNEHLQASLAIQSADGGWKLSLNGREAVLNEEKLITLLFDPNPELPETLDAELKSDLAVLFPAPLPYDRGLNYV